MAGLNHGGRRFGNGHAVPWRGTPFRGGGPPFLGGGGPPPGGGGFFFGAPFPIKPAGGGGEHAAVFIATRPPSVTLASAFPDDGPAQKVAEPVYLGGPVGADAIFALTRGSESPGKGSIQLMPGLFAALDGKAVDRVIASDPQHTRFLAGLVVWKPGELDEEIQQGLWYVLEPDPSLVLPASTEGLWEELARRSKIAAEAI